MSYIEADPNPLRPIFKFRCRMANKGQNLPKNLLSNFIEEDSDVQNDDTIKVYLRVKPSADETENNIEVVDDRTIRFKMSPDLALSRKKLNIPDEYKYTFSQVYRSNATQAEIFTGCVSPLVKDLFDGDGRHCLLFTYGTTNAGKTFTVLGTGDQPGIIPRTLTTVFKSIKGKEYTHTRIRPHMFDDAEIVTDETLLSEQEFKQRILNWNPDKTQSESSRLARTHTTTASSIDDIIGEAVFKEMQRRLTNDTSIVEYHAEQNEKFSVWVSFGEIYNELIYDLLQPVTIHRKRKALKLASDSRKNMYIKGLKHVMVQSEEEAYKVLMFGKNNLQVAATGMNTQSSRSHCIFTIRLLRYPNADEPNRIIVSSFAICDLAGAERQKKTLNEGLRLKESQNINSSLHVLSRCFSVIRENQLNNENKMVPFRDSKLTQLFQHALQGKEVITMIVNVNAEKHLAEETQHVLKATAIAKQIVVQPKLQPRKPKSTRMSMFSQLVRHNRSTLIRWDSCVRPKAPNADNSQTLSIVSNTELNIPEEPSEIAQKQDDYQNLLVLVESLKDKLKVEKEKHVQTKKAARQREDEIRDEMQAELDAMLEQNKRQNQLDLKREQEIVEPVCTKREGHPSSEIPVRSKKMKSTMDVDEDDNSFLIGDLQEEVKEQQTQIDGLTQLVNMLRQEKKQLSMELSSAKMQMVWKEKDLVNVKKKLETLSDEGGLKTAYVELDKEMQAEIKARNELLDEARADMLEELSKNEDLEEDMKKLEAELEDKEQEVATLHSRVEELEYDQKMQNHTINLLENHIEEVEYKLEVETKELESQKSKLEEELKQKTDEFTKLMAETTAEKEELRQLRTDHEALLQRSDNDCLQLSAKEEQIRCLREELHATAASSTSVEALKEELEEKLQEEIVRVIIETGEEAKMKLEQLEREFAEKMAEQEKLLAETERLAEESGRERDAFKLDLEQAKTTAQELQRQLTEKSDKINLFEKKINALQATKDKCDNEQSSEISILEQNLKKQIQETTRVMTEKAAKTAEAEELLKKSNKYKALAHELTQTVQRREHEVDCLKREITGYRDSLPTLQSELEQKRRELGDCKIKLDDQMAAIFNLEKERESFLGNQKEIIGKYEEQLKKTKDEVELLKKEIARVTTTFYKSTPTPKKDLEKKVESLQKQNSELAKKVEECNCQQLSEDLSRMKLAMEGPDKENDVFELEYPPKPVAKSRTVRSRLLPEQEEVLRAQSSNCEEKLSTLTSTTSERKTSKSASKSKPKRTTRAASTVASLEVPHCDSKESSEVQRPQKPLRKKLYDATVDVTNISAHDSDMEEIPPESPRSLIKRKLRERKQQ